MKRKAIENLESAQILLNNRHYTTSVHCSYYAVFQYMKYILANTKNRPMPYELQNNRGLGSHEFIFYEIKNRIQNPNMARDFACKIRNLKQLRVMADYDVIQFTDIESLDYKRDAEKLIANLKNNFGNL